MSGAWYTARRPDTSALAEAVRTGKLIGQLNDVPSHNRRYRATLRPQVAESGAIAGWWLLVETTDGKVPASPSLVMESWMPDEPSTKGIRPRATYVGHGVFGVDLRFGRPGWWNVRVTLSDEGATDSLAFNLIVPNRGAGR
jgi:hypothetical protein